MGNPDPDWFRFDNSDGKLERPDMRQFERDLDAAVAHTRKLESLRDAWIIVHRATLNAACGPASVWLKLHRIEAYIDNQIMVLIEGQQ